MTTSSGVPAGPRRSRSSAAWLPRRRCSTWGRNGDFEHVHVQDSDAAVAETLSVSFFARLPAERRVPLGRELRAALPDTTWRTPLRAKAYWTRLRS